ELRRSVCVCVCDGGRPQCAEVIYHNTTTCNTTWRTNGVAARSLIGGIMKTCADIHQLSNPSQEDRTALGGGEREIKHSRLHMARRENTRGKRDRERERERKEYRESVKERVGTG